MQLEINWVYMMKNMDSYCKLKWSGIDMPLTINVITENNYFFVGVKEKLNANRNVVRKLMPYELKSTSISEFSKDDILILHASSHIDEFLFIVSTALFPGKIIFIPVSGRGNFSLALKKHVVLDTYASFENILHEIANNQDNEVVLPNLMRDRLTKREKTILLHTISGMDAQSIGHSLSISKKTVYAHRRNALHKLGGRNFFEVWPVRDKSLRADLF